MNYKGSLISSSLLVFFLSTLFSCHTVEPVAYFKDLSDSGKVVIAKTPAFTSPTIEPDDLLSIGIQTLDPQANALFTQGNISTSSLGGSSAAGGATAQTIATSGYLVDKLGDVQLPIIGIQHLAGLTTIQARDTLKVTIAKLFKNPTVEVNFANIKVTVLGEVVRPATYTVVNEKTNIFEALGLAGDMTIYGRRDNVLLIRDTLGAKQLVRLNLNLKNIIESPYFFLKPNDVIYVEPNKSKVLSTDAYRLRNYTIAAAALSLLIVAAARLK